MSKRRLATDRECLRWARHAVAGVDQSGLMLGVLSDQPGGGRLEFALQIGHCLLEGKPLVLIAPRGAVIPEKLRAAASAIEFFDPTNEASAMNATKRALEAVGRPVRH